LFVRTELEETYAVHEAANGPAGIELAGRQIPDLIIVDRMMPGMDGVEVCHALKTDDKTSHIPLLMLTARRSSESELEGLTAGADDYVTKPFNSAILLARIHNLLEARRQLRERIQHSLSEHRPIAPDAGAQRFFERARTLVEAHLSDPDFDVDQFAAQLHMSRATLWRKFKALCDQTPSTFIRNVRLENAATLIKGGRCTVTEAAFQVGFQDVSHFSRAFKEFHGCSPSQYQ
jgi:DNA-binding response OmpR family regulator